MVTHVVLIRNSLMIHDVEHLFISLFAICIFSLVWCLQKSFQDSKSMFTQVWSDGHLGAGSPELPVRNAEDWTTSSPNVLGFSNALKTEKH